MSLQQPFFPCPKSSEGGVASPPPRLLRWKSLARRGRPAAQRHHRQAGRRRSIHHWALASFWVSQVEKNPEILTHDHEDLVCCLPRRENRLVCSPWRRKVGARTGAGGGRRVPPLLITSSTWPSFVAGHRKLLFAATIFSPPLGPHTHTFLTHPSREQSTPRAETRTDPRAFSG